MQVDAAAIMSVGTGGAHAPQWPRDELPGQGAIVIALVETGAYIMALEVAVDVLDQELAAIRRLDGGKACIVIHLMQKGCSGGKQVIEIAADGIISSLQVGDPAVMLDQQVGNMAGGAADLVKEPSAIEGLLGLLVDGRLEVMKKVELLMVHQAHGQFIGNAITIRISAGIGQRWSFNLVQRTIQDHA